LHDYSSWLLEKFSSFITNSEHYKLAKVLKQPADLLDCPPTN